LLPGPSGDYPRQPLAAQPLDEVPPQCLRISNLLCDLLRSFTSRSKRRCPLRPEALVRSRGARGHRLGLLSGTLIRQGTRHPSLHSGSPYDCQYRGSSRPTRAGRRTRHTVGDVCPSDARECITGGQGLTSRRVHHLGSGTEHVTASPAAIDHHHLLRIRAPEEAARQLKENYGMNHAPLQNFAANGLAGGSIGLDRRVDFRGCGQAIPRHWTALTCPGGGDHRRSQGSSRQDRRSGRGPDARRRLVYPVPFH
jgi:hypothetical protein